MFQNISIILVEPAGDENVGMVARAIKNCDITDLRLINPAAYRTRAAAKWACHAKDILGEARVYSKLKEAVADASLVVGLSRREGKLRPPASSFAKTISKIYLRAKKSKVALVFGREDDGLTRTELDQCDVVVSIPTSSVYPSLNLAQAVLLVCHELFKRGNAKKAHKIINIANEFVTREEVGPIFNELQDVLIKLGYDDRDKGNLRDKIIRQFSELFGRGGMRRKDVNMFLGLLARVAERAK